MAEPEMDGTASTAVADSPARDQAAPTGSDQTMRDRLEQGLWVRGESRNRAENGRAERAERDAERTDLPDHTRSANENSDQGVLVRVRTQLPEFTGALQRVAEQ